MAIGAAHFSLARAAGRYQKYLQANEAILQM
jgi:hypothetical protein